MKGLLLITILLSGLSVHAVSDCRQVKDRMVMFCESLPTQCEFIKSCLHRRDTCVEKSPKTDQECHRLNNCTKKIAANFSDSEKCNYKWNVNDEGKGMCHVDRSIFFQEEGCPGHIGGVISALAYGLDSTVDSRFSCKTTEVLYRKKLESCNEYRKKFEKDCMVEDSAEDVAALKEASPEVCLEYKEFDRIPAGAFYIDAEGIEEYSSNNRFRGSQNIIPSGRGYRVKKGSTAGQK